MFNFSNNNNKNTTTLGGTLNTTTTGNSNSFLSSSSWMNNNNNSSILNTGGLFKTTPSNNLGGFTNNNFANTMFSAGGAGASTSTNSLMTNNSGSSNIFSTNSFNNNNKNTTTPSFANSSNPFTTNISNPTTSTNGFPSLSNSNNTFNSTFKNQSSLPSFVPTPVTSNSGERLNYYSMSMMDQYKNKSHEECRFDYWNAQKNGIAPSTTVTTNSSSNTLGSGNQWMNNSTTTTSGNNTTGSITNNNPWSIPSSISTNNTSLNNNGSQNTLFNFSGNNSTSTNNVAPGSFNWLSNNNNNTTGNNTNNGSSAVGGSNMFNNTNNTSSIMIGNNNTTGSMFNNSANNNNNSFNLGLNSSSSNNSLPNNNSSFNFNSSVANHNPSPMFNNTSTSTNNLGSMFTNDSSSNNMFNTTSAVATNNQPSQPFSWNSNFTSSNPTTTTGVATSFPSIANTTSGTINTTAFQSTPSNFMGDINTDATLLSLLNQPYGENTIYEEKYQPSTFMNKFEVDEPTDCDTVITKETSLPNFSCRPKLGKPKKTTLVDKLNFINAQAQIEDKHHTEDNLFDDIAFRQKNSLKELTIFPNNAFKNKNEKPINATVQKDIETIEYHEEHELRNTMIVRKSFQQDQRKASPPSNSELIKPKPIKGMIFHDDSIIEKKDQVTIPKYLPKLTKEGYYTVPSMADLRLMSTEDLKNCRNFIIGRSGYGEIQVLGSLDLTRGLDLDRIVFAIEKHHVELYNNYSFNEKPPIGSELNRPCIVTLFNVHPSNNKSLSTSRMKSNEVILSQFQAKLKKANHKSGSEFINYSGGEWIFKVNHF